MAALAATKRSSPRRGERSAAAFLRAAESQPRRQVFKGPYRINGQRDKDEDGIPDPPDLQQLSGSEFVDPREMAKMCWYVNGVVEKQNLTTLPSDDVPALVPGGLVPGAREKNTVVTPADHMAYAKPQNLRWECRLNVFH